MKFESPFADKDAKPLTGNIWGWKFSFISLFIIVALLLLSIYRYSKLDTSPPIFNDQELTERDSTDR